VRWVPHAAMRPHRCAVIPFVGNSSSKYGFLDTGMDLPGWDPHVYISGEAVLEMMRAFGFDRPTADPRVKTLEARVQELQVKLAEAAKFREATEYTLEAFGSKVKNKPGRKPAERAVA
jgi:hypothetical protein